MRSDLTSDHDVVVVGGRVAGAATAMLLARCGLDVLLVDRGSYGSDTMSTHALMRGAVLQLHRWGLLERIVSAGTPAHPAHDVPLRRRRGHRARQAGRRRRRPLRPAPHGARSGPRRRGRGRRAPRSATASRSPTCSATVTVSSGSGVATPSGRPFRAFAWLVVGADGIRSTIAERVGAPVDRHGTGASATTYGYWSGLATDGYEWNFRPDASSGVIPTNDGQACVFASATPRRIGRGGAAAITDIVAGDRRRSSPPASPRPDRPLGVRTFNGRVGYVPAVRGARAGRSSATPGTSRIRSAPTASPMRSATPSCWPGAVVAVATERRHRGRRARRLPASTRRAVGRPVRRRRRHGRASLDGRRDRRPAAAARARRWATRSSCSARSRRSTARLRSAARSAPTSTRTTSVPRRSARSSASRTSGRTAPAPSPRRRRASARKTRSRPRNTGVPRARLAATERAANDAAAAASPTASAAWASAWSNGRFGHGPLTAIRPAYGPATARTWRRRAGVVGELGGLGEVRDGDRPRIDRADREALVAQPAQRRAGRRDVAAAGLGRGERAAVPRLARAGRGPLEPRHQLVVAALQAAGGDDRRLGVDAPGADAHATTAP